MRAAPLLVLLIVACEPARPLPPLEVRLGEVPAPDLPSPSAPPERAARGFLLPAPRWAETDAGVRLDALPDGTLDGLEIAWSAQGGTLAADGATAVLTPEGPWSVAVELRRGDAVVARAEVRNVPPRPAPGGWRRAGTVPLDPLGCGDAWFPRQAGTGYLGCSVPGSLDSWLPLRAESAVPIVGPALGSDPTPLPLPPGTAAVATGDRPVAVWAGERLVVWGPDRAPSARPLGHREARGRPAADGERLAIARADRIEVGPLDGAARVQVAAEPADVEAPVAIGGPWVAVIEGPVGAERLRLLDPDRRVGAVLAEGRPRDPVLGDGWLAWLADDGIRTLDLRTGQERFFDAEPASGAPAAVGARAVVALRGGRIAAIHVPTGSIEWLQAGGPVELRGGGAGGFTAWVRAGGAAGEQADGAGELVRWELAGHAGAAR